MFVSDLLTCIFIEGPLNTYPEEGIDRDLGRTQWWGAQVPEGNVWKAKDIVLQNIVHEARSRLDGPKGSQEDALEKPYKYFSLSNSLTENEGETANFYVFQKVFRGDFQFDVLFRSKSNPEPITSKYYTYICILK